MHNEELIEKLKEFPPELNVYLVDNFDSRFTNYLDPDPVIEWINRDGLTERAVIL